MLNYKVNLSGTVQDTKTGFKCGFDISVENGGSVAAVAGNVQQAIESCAENAITEEK